MENKANNDSFKYTYSAKEQEEIKKIRKKANRTMKNVGYMIEGYINGK